MTDTNDRALAGSAADPEIPTAREYLDSSFPPGAATREWLDGWDSCRQFALGAAAELVAARPGEPSLVHPADMVLVPREPTKAMLEAAVKSRHGPAIYKVSLAATEEEEAAEDYRAMLAATPSQAVADERSAFFAWVKDCGCDTDGAWSAWQARAALATPSQAVAAEVEPPAEREARLKAALCEVFGWKQSSASPSEQVREPAKPLTEEKILTTLNSLQPPGARWEGPRAYSIALVRAIEAAHGIVPTDGEQA